MADVPLLLAYCPGFFSCAVDPDYGAIFAANGFTREKNWTKWNGFLVSEIWRIR